jgi:CysZ protein
LQQPGWFADFEEGNPPMIIEAARLAGSNLLLPGITLGAVQVAGADNPACSRAVVRPGRGVCRSPCRGSKTCFPDCPDWAGWAGTVAAVIAGIGLALVLALFVAPVTAAMAGCFSTTSPR